MHLLGPQSFSAAIEFPLPRIEPGCPLFGLACNLVGEDAARVVHVASDGLELMGDQPCYALTHRTANRSAVPPPHRPHRIRDRDLHRLDTTSVS